MKIKLSFLLNSMPCQMINYLIKLLNRATEKLRKIANQALKKTKNKV